ncbi:MAG TPA: maleylpyruvate isomerase family mycothiol-dependent enzyme [Roseiflexaceae bacterium]|nr:maleylpyruvate isomerase family mycothiol-dependent enzyme [Roseiflexaceae bacterium]
MITATPSHAATDAARIPYVTADEAYTLLRTELERLLALAEALSPADWTRPTACTAWTVRDILAHQAGSYASGTSYREMIRQYRARPRPGQLPEDAVNDLQLAERADRSPADLIAEVRRLGPIAIQKWAYQFRLVTWLGVPHPVPGILWMRHLMWVIHSRDTWMHRLDICRATERPFEQTSGHDTRIAALVMRDVAQTLGKRLGRRAVIFDLTGVAGGVWQIGVGDAAATIQMDALDFNIYASGRYSYAEGRARAEVRGDAALAEMALKHAQALY